MHWFIDKVTFWDVQPSKDGRYLNFQLKKSCMYVRTYVCTYLASYSYMHVVAGCRHMYTVHSTAHAPTTDSLLVICHHDPAGCHVNTLPHLYLIAMVTVSLFVQSRQHLHHLAVAQSGTGLVQVAEQN